MADVAKSGGLDLQPLAVRRYGAVTLHHGVKFVEEEDGAWLLVGVEDPFNGHPQITSGGIGTVHGEVEDGVVDGAGDLAPDAALRGIPLRIIRSRGSRAVDVRAKAELAAQRLEEERPLGVVGLKVQRNRDVRLDTDCGVVVSHDRCSSAGAHGRHGGSACRGQGAGTGGRGGGGGEGGRRVHRRGEREQPVRVDGHEGVARVGAAARSGRGHVGGRVEK